jgi:hypothetical protein
MPRETCPCSFASLVVLGAEGEHVRDIHAGQQLGREIAGDEGCLEPVDPRGHGRVRGEDGSRPHDLQRLGERQPAADQVADAFEPEEPGVAFVGVEHRGCGRAGQLGEHADRTHAADAEQQLLQQTVLAAAAVETVGDRAQFVVVLRHVGVEQQQCDAADLDLPDACGERASVREGEGDHGRAAVGVAHDAERKAVGVEDRVRLLLPAFARDGLAEVAGAVEQTDRDDRHTEVGCALQVVAGENAEAARVLRQCGGDAELRREVRDRRGCVLQRLVPARFGDVGVQLVEQSVRPGDEVVVGRELVEP